MELYVSGTGLSRDHGRGDPAEVIIARARAGELRAREALDRYVDRLARGLAVVCDVLDPDTIVIGGGMSNVAELYETLPGAIAGHVFSDTFLTTIVPAAHGDSSGVRGAAWLWPLDASNEPPA